jgi:hypothetical protein
LSIARRVIELSVNKSFIKETRSFLLKVISDDYVNMILIPNSMKSTSFKNLEITTNVFNLFKLDLENMGKDLFVKLEKDDLSDSDIEFLQVDLN